MLNAIKTIRNRCKTLIPFPEGVFLQGVSIEKLCFLCTGWIYATTTKRIKTDIEP